VWRADVELSLAQVFRLLSEGGVPLDHYIAYAHLTRLGFILARTRLPPHEGQSPGTELQLYLSVRVRDG
jgi:hypothetical protein